MRRDIVAAVAELPVVGDETFQREVLEAEGPVVVDFWAPWCGPCRVVNPILADMADEHGDRMKFLQLNVDENPETQARYSVLSIPTVIVFEAGASNSLEIWRGIPPRIAPMAPVVAYDRAGLGHGPRQQLRRRGW